MKTHCVSEANVSRVFAALVTAVVIVLAFVSPRLLVPATRPLQDNEQKLVGSWRFICPDHIHFGADRTWRHTTVYDFELESGHWALLDSDHLLMQSDRVTIGDVSLDRPSTHVLHGGQVAIIDETVAEVETSLTRWKLSRTRPDSEAGNR